jgi:hypothetical protein
MQKNLFNIIIVLTSIIGCTGLLSAQHESKWELIKQISAKADNITTDNLGNFYLIKKEEIIKYDNNGNLINTFSDKSLGPIHSVDATNFLKLLVFYKDFSKIVFLDNFLAPVGTPLQLVKIQFEQAVLASSSHNNGFWLYDQLNFELTRFNQNFTIANQSGNLMQLLQIQLKPVFLLEQNNRLFLNNPQTGILLFDIFATYSKTIPIKGLSTFQVVENLLFYVSEGKLKSYNILTLEESTMELPVPNILNARLDKNRLFLQTDHEIFIYKRN